MRPNILFSDPALWEDYRLPLRGALREEGLADAQLACASEEGRSPFPPQEVDYIVHAASAPLCDFSPFTRLRAVLSLWAGVEALLANPTLTQPLCKMVDPGLSEGMVEWVVGHCLRHHLGMDRHIINPERAWSAALPPLARERRVSVLGLGALGAAAAQALAALHFPVTGWSRTPKELAGVRCLSGMERLSAALEQAEIIVALLPLTAQTEGLLDARAFAAAARGAVVLNPGRGALIDDEALLDALNSGQIAHATLDVFRQEPLPKEHPFWAHPCVTVTPHIAASTRPATAARMIAKNIRQGESGAELLHLVERHRGY